MLKSELFEIIANGENSGVEFKRDDVRPEVLAKEVVALLNLRGGKILLGVEDDGTISGIARDNLEEWIMNVFYEKIHPQVIPFYEEVAVDSEKKVAVVSFPPGISKPYIVRHNGREEIFIRLGSTSRHASREQQATLHAMSASFHPETQPIAGTSFASLRKDVLSDYLMNVLHETRVPESDGAWLDRLVGLGLMTKVAEHRPMCTLAGVLLFSPKPRSHLRHAGVRLMVFQGEDKEYSALLDSHLDAPLLAGSGQGDLPAGGLIDTFFQIIQPFVSQESSTLAAGTRRHRHWYYPQEAMWEALVNALVHRDWTRPVDIKVVVYSNRMEIISPGAMQNAMNVSKMIAGQRSPRNPILVEILRDYGYVDARGMGVRTKIIPSMRKHNGVDPLFEATEDYLKVVLPRGGGGKGEEGCC